MTDEMTPDQQAREWCEEASLGKREAACKLVSHFHRIIYAYLRRLTGNDEDAADLTQETFTKTWQSLTKFRGASTVATWIHRIAYFSYVDWLRKRKPVAAQPEDWWDAVPCGQPSPFDITANVDSSRRLYSLVEALEPETRRAAIHLHYYQGLSLGETAEVLGMPVSTLKHQLRSALDELKSQLIERPKANLNPTDRKFP